MQDKNRKKSKINDRLLKFIELKLMNKSEFYLKTSLSNGFLDKESNLRADSIEKIILAFPEIDLEWLLTGKGEMLKADIADYKTTAMGSAEKLLKAVESNEGVPLLPISAMAGWGKGDFAILRNDIQIHYSIPELKNKADFMIRISGSSMLPKYASGDVIACRFIGELTFVQWGRVYVMDTVQGAIIKRLFPGSTKDRILCRSENETYPEFEISYKDVRAVALVVGSVRFD